MMFIYIALNDGKVLVMEEWHVCSLCCKMINLNEQPHNRVYFAPHKGYLYSHKICDTLKKLPIIKIK